MNTGIAIAIAVIIVSTVQMAYIYYRSRVDRLTEREETVNEAIASGLFEKYEINTRDGFIFCSLWRLSDIYSRAKLLGYSFDIHDCYKVVGMIKRDFDKVEGINYNTLDRAIKAYVNGLMNVPNGWGLVEKSI